MPSKVFTNQLYKKFSYFFSDENLTQKAYLNAIAFALDYGARIIVALILTPWLVSGMGDYFFGVWQILNRVVGYMTPTSGKPTEVLKSAIANQHNSVEYELKRSYVGATLLLWVFFLPILGVTGSIISWFVPFWIHSPEKYIGIVRITTGILVINLAAGSISNLPQSVLEGENLGYKRIGFSALLSFIGGGVTWLALDRGFGIIGVASVAVLMTLLTGGLYFFITRQFVSWFGITRPSLGQLKYFARLSWWFLSWNMFMNLMITMDVVLLGFLRSAEIVTSYTLMKYIPETIVGVMAVIIFGTIPGLGGIIGSGDFERAVRVREELILITWMIVTSLGASIIIWNHSFINLWVGQDYYIGDLQKVLIILLVIQFIFIRIDSYIIDVTLHLKGKIITGIVSITLSIVIAVLLLEKYNLGIVGLCLGILIGRSIMSFGFPVLVSRFLNTSHLSQIKEVWRLGLVTTFVFSVSYFCGSKIPYDVFAGITGWIMFISLAVLTLGFISIIVFLVGLSNHQKTRIRNRIQTLFSKLF